MPFVRVSLDFVQIEFFVLQVCWLSCAGSKIDFSGLMCTYILWVFACKFTPEQLALFFFCSTFIGFVKINLIWHPICRIAWWTQFLGRPLYPPQPQYIGSIQFMFACFEIDEHMILYIYIHTSWIGTCMYMRIYVHIYTIFVWILQIAPVFDNSTCNDVC